MEAYPQVKSLSSKVDPEVKHAINTIVDFLKRIAQEQGGVSVALYNDNVVLWAQLSKKGSKLLDLEERRHMDLTQILGADTSDTSSTKDRHVSNLQAKAWQDHITIAGNPHATSHSALNNVGTVDTADTDATKDKHVSNALAKAWTDEARRFAFMR